MVRGVPRVSPLRQGKLGKSYAVTISLKSAIPEKPLSTPSISPRCAPAPQHPDQAPSLCRKTHPPPAAAWRSSQAPRRMPALPAALQPREPTSLQHRAISQLRGTASPHPANQRQIFFRCLPQNVVDTLEGRRNCLKIADARAAVSASARAIASRTSSASAASTAFTTS